MGWAPDYVTTGELAAYTRIGDSVDDAQIGLAIAAASRAIDQATGRQFGLLDAAAARYFTARWDSRECQWVVPCDDLMTTTDLSVAVDTVGEGDYDGVLTGVVPCPRNAVGTGRPWTELRVTRGVSVQPAGIADGVRVTARWGWSTVPDAIKQATLLQASRLLSRRDSPYGIAGSAELGSEMRLLARLDADVAVAVRPYRRVWGAV